MAWYDWWGLSTAGGEYIAEQAGSGTSPGSPNLFVIGASNFPQNASYNPTGTLGALKYLQDVHPTTVAGRLAEALAYSGAAALGFGDPAEGTRRAAEVRRIALETGDEGTLDEAFVYDDGERQQRVWRVRRGAAHP